MKRNTLMTLLVGLVVTFTFGMKVSAGTVSISCEKQELEKGESTVCNINANGFTEAITSFSAEVNTNYLLISNITPNSTIGMRDNNSTNELISFTNTSMTTVTGDVTLGSFTLTLSKDAQDIGDGTCGSFCLRLVKVNDKLVDNFGETQSGICTSPGFVEEKCEGEGCDPETGAFTSYVLLGSGALVALVAILLVRKNSKFYNV